MGNDFEMTNGWCFYALLTYFTHQTQLNKCSTKKCEESKKTEHTHGQIIIMIIAIHVVYLLLWSVKHTHSHLVHCKASTIESSKTYDRESVRKRTVYVCAKNIE